MWCAGPAGEGVFIWVPVNEHDQLSNSGPIRGFLNKRLPWPNMEYILILSLFVSCRSFGVG